MMSYATENLLKSLEEKKTCDDFFDVLNYTSSIVSSLSLFVDAVKSTYFFQLNGSDIFVQVLKISISKDSNICSVNWVKEGPEQKAVMRRIEPCGKQTIQTITKTQLDPGW